MTARMCRAPGCGARTSRYGQFCSTHRSRSRRHGHPEQEGITKAQLKPFVKLVRTRITKNETNTVWDLCEARWRALALHAQHLIAARKAGQAGSRYERIAAQEIVKLASTVEASAVMETTFAMFLLEDQQPRRFRSDASFRSQLVRRLRGLSEVNAGVWFSPATGKTKRAYRDLAPRAVMIMAAWVIEALGGVGRHLAKLEQDERIARQQRVNEYFEAVAQLR